MAQEFHSEDIKLLLGGVTKYFSWHLEYPFQENDLDVRAYLSKALKKPTVSIKKELQSVLQNYDHIMLFMMCGMHLDRDVHTVGDLSDLVQQGIGSYPQTPQNKGKGSSRLPKTSTKATFVTELAIEQGTLSQLQEVEKDSGDKDTREDRNNQQEQCTSGNDPEDSGSDSFSDSGSSSVSSVQNMLRPRNNNQRGLSAKSIEQEQ